MTRRAACYSLQVLSRVTTLLVPLFLQTVSPQERPVACCNVCAKIDSNTDMIPVMDLMTTLEWSNQVISVTF